MIQIHYLLFSGISIIITYHFDGVEWAFKYATDLTAKKLKGFHK
jgi:hypothetical protein